MAKTVHKIAVIGGDGTGPEVVAEGLKVLNAAAQVKWFKNSKQLIMILEGNVTLKQGNYFRIRRLRN